MIKPASNVHIMLKSNVLGGWSTLQCVGACCVHADVWKWGRGRRRLLTWKEFAYLTFQSWDPRPCVGRTLLEPEARKGVSAEGGSSLGGQGRQMQASTHTQSQQGADEMDTVQASRYGSRLLKPQETRHEVLSHVCLVLWYSPKLPANDVWRVIREKWRSGLHQDEEFFVTGHSEQVKSPLVEEANRHTFMSRECLIPSLHEVPL